VILEIFLPKKWRKIGAFGSINLLPQIVQYICLKNTESLAENCQIENSEYI
jgi:hypothetical protein